MELVLRIFTILIFVDAIVDKRNGPGGYGTSPFAQAIMDMNGSSDYVELFGAVDGSSDDTALAVQGNSSIDFTYMGGFLLSAT